MPRFLRQLKDIGFCGVQNFPTVGLIDGTFRQNLEETGMSYSLEVDMIREARQLDLLTCPYVFTVADAEAMTRAGAGVEATRGKKWRRGGRHCVRRCEWRGGRGGKHRTLCDDAMARGIRTMSGSSDAHGPQL